MGIDVRLEGAESQASSAKSAFSGMTIGLGSLKNSITNYTTDTSTLKGMAFESSRQYQTDVIQPIIEVAKNYIKAVSEATEKLPKEYTARVDSKSWSEEELQELIESEQSALNSLRAASQSLDKLDVKVDKKASMQARNKSMMARHEANLAKYQEILQKLRDFDSYSATLFSEADDLKGVLQEALGKAKDAWNPQTHTFDASKAGYFTTLANLTKAGKSFSKEDLQFVENLKAQYGFDDETAGQIVQVRKGLEKKFPDKSQADIDYYLLRILGGTVYDGTKWDATAGGLSKDFGNMTITEIFKELGLSTKEAKQLNYNIRLQHQISGDAGKAMSERASDATIDEYRKAYNEAYGTNYKTALEFRYKWSEIYNRYSDNEKYTNADFAHQSITMATILHNPSKTVQDLAGWRGDVTRDAEATPSMGNDDYLADLDAVNLAQRMKNGASLFEASNDYYANADSVREEEFLENQGGYNNVADRIFTSMVPGYNDPTQRPPISRDTALNYLKNNSPVTYNFLMSLKDKDNKFD